MISPEYIGRICLHILPLSREGPSEVNGAHLLMHLHLGVDRVLLSSGTLRALFPLDLFHRLHVLYWLTLLLILLHDCLVTHLGFWPRYQGGGIVRTIVLGPRTSAKGSISGLARRVDLYSVLVIGL